MESRTRSMRLSLAGVSTALCILGVSLISHPALANNESVLIDVPTYYGLEPKLTLAHSAKGDSPLQGMSAITRVSKDGKGAPRYDGTDTWLYNGQTLMMCSAGIVSPSCDPANAATMPGLTYYYARIENFLRIGYDGDRTWHIWDKRGTQYTHTRQGAYHSASYPLVAVRDTVGHLVVYSYTHGAPSSVADNNYYLSTIKYSNNQVTLTLLYEPRPDALEAGIGAWGDSSTHPPLLTITRRLQQVKVSRQNAAGVDTPIRYYNLGYTVPSNGNGRSLLSTIQQCGSDGTTCLPAATFASVANRSRDGEFSPSGGPTQYTTPSAWTASTDPTPLLSFPATMPNERNGSWDPGWAGTVGTFGAPELFGGAYGKPTLIGDYNGDRRPDAFFLQPVAANTTYPYAHLRIRVIVNLPSDPTTPGQADRFFSRDTETGQMLNQPLWGYTDTAKADIAHNQALFAGQMLTMPFTWPYVAFVQGRGWAELPYRDFKSLNAINSNVHALDVNGDGLSDFVALNYHAANETRTCAPYDHYAIATVVNSGTFTADSDWIYGTQETAVAFGAPKVLYFDDINGDGRTDIMMVARSNFTTVINAQTEIGYGLSFLSMLSILGATGANHTLSNEDLSNAFSPPQRQPISYPTWIKEWDVDNQFFAGDVNGDGKTDWVTTAIHDANRLGDTFSYKHVALRTFLSVGGTGTTFLFADVGESDVLGLSTEPILRRGPGNPVWGPKLQWFLGDYNGDGLLDLGFQSGHLNCDARARAVGASGEAVNYECTLGDMYPHAVFTTILSRGDGQWLVGEEWDTGLCDGAWGYDNFTGSHKGFCVVPNLEYQSADMNGDGLVDITRIFGVSGNVFIKHFFSDGSGSTWDQRPARINNSPVLAGADMRIVDVDGDGFNDIMQMGTNVSYWRNPAGGYEPASFRHLVATMFTPPFEGNNDGWKTGDWNGDGRLDAVYVKFLAPGLQLRSVLQSTIGTWNSLASQDITSGQRLSSPGVQQMIPADVDGDGRTDLVYVAPYSVGGGSNFSVGVYSYRFNPATNNWILSFEDGSGWVGAGGTRGLATGGVNHLGWMAGDVNGDGKTDLIRVQAGQVQSGEAGFQVFVLISNGNGRWSYTAFNSGTSRYGVFDDVSQQVNNWKLADLNGDGRTDLFRVVRVGIHNFRVDSLIAKSFDPVFGWFSPRQGLEMRSRGSEMGATSYINQVDVAHWQVSNINRDGVADLLKVSFVGYQSPTYTTKLVVEMLSGSGNGDFRGPLFGPGSVSALPGYPFYALLDLPTDGRINSLRFQTADLNNDGLSDLTHFAAEYTGASNAADRIYVSSYLFQTKAEGLTSLANYSAAKQPYLTRAVTSIDGRVHSLGGTFTPARRNLRRWWLADVDGDGVLDAINLGFNFSSLTTQPVSILAAPGLSSPGDLLGTVTSPFGSVTTMTYTPSTFQARINDPAAGCLLPGVRQVVDSMTTEGSRINLSYECPHYSFAERQFLGWETTVVREPVAPGEPATSVHVHSSVFD